MNKKDLRTVYIVQRAQAKHRNIPFLLTFEEWFKIWLDSGHLHERGCRRGQYVMARFGDKGPYAVGNVAIITSADNLKSRQISAETRKRMSSASKLRKPPSYLGHHHTAEAKEKISAYQLGTRRTAETRAKMSAAKRAYWARMKETKLP